MNDELLNQDISEYLSHSGVPGMSWYKHKFGKWQPQAVYAHGMLNPEESKPSNTSIKKELRLAVDKIDHSKNKNEAYKTYFKLALNILTLNRKGIDKQFTRIMYANASKKAEIEDRKQIDRLKIDPKTGLHLKKKQMNEIEDAGYVNPGYLDFNSNTKQNCVLCTVAYELRRRGYDVQANKAGIGYDPEYIKRWFPKAKFSTLNVTKDDVFNLGKKEWRDEYEKAINGLNIDYANNVINELKKQGDGARGYIAIQFGYAGHAVSYTVNNGKVMLLDSQRGAYYEDPKLLLRYSMQNTFTRLDNLDFDIDTVKEAVR